MKDKNQNKMLFPKQPTNEYDDGDIPRVDLPRDSYPLEMPADIIPDEVPRKDGPGGGGENIFL